MPNRRTRKRRAGKKLAKNVASVLRQRIENMRAREANNAEALFREYSGYYNAPENHFNENAMMIASLTPAAVFSAPVKSKKSKTSKKRGLSVSKKLLRTLQERNILNALKRHSNRY
jgi:hypothetical protein